MEDKNEDIIAEKDENKNIDIIENNNEENQENTIPEEINNNESEPEKDISAENDEKNDDSKETEDNNENKGIDIVDGDGSTLVISPVYEHIDAAKPKVNDKDPNKIIIPEEKKIEKSEENN